MKIIYIVLSIAILSFNCIAEEKKPDIEFTEWGYIVINKASDEALKELKKYDKKESVRIDFSNAATQLDFDTIIKNNSWIKHLATDMWNQHIGNIDAVSKLKSLESIKLNSLKKSVKNPISLVSLEKHKNLIKIDLYGTHITGTESLSKLTLLEDVNLYMSNANSIDFLKSTPNIKKLNLYGNKHTFQNYMPISNLKHLEDLDIYMNPQATDENLAALKNLTTLKEISMAHDDQVTNLNFLKGNENLSKLNANWCNNLIDISALKDLPSLKLLTLSDTLVTQLDVLKGKSQLEWLDISGTKVKDISILSDLVNLRFLDISETEISDITPLFKLENLKTLHIDEKISTNQIDNLKKALPNINLIVES